MQSDTFLTIRKIATLFHPEISDLTTEECQKLNLIYSGILDSFNVMNFVLEIEKAFQVQIPAECFEDRRLHRLDSICDIIDDLRP